MSLSNTNPHMDANPVKPAMPAQANEEISPEASQALAEKPAASEAFLPASPNLDPVPESMDAELPGEQSTENSPLPEPDAQADAWMQAFEATTQKAGLNAEQSEQLLSWLHDTSRQSWEQTATEETQLQQQMQHYLQAEWGLHYTRNLSLARRALRELSAKTGDAKALERVLTQAGLADDPEVLKIFHALGEETADAPMIGLGRGERLGISPAQLAQKHIASFTAKGNLSQALYNPRDPQHETAVAQLQKLYETAYNSRDPYA